MLLSVVAVEEAADEVEVDAAEEEEVELAVGVASTVLLEDAEDEEKSAEVEVGVRVVALAPTARRAMGRREEESISSDAGSGCNE